jgi:NAD(P)-dependent dehydrogenase (short-subunit alcohol dehydrogenase family)
MSFTKAVNRSSLVSERRTTPKQSLNGGTTQAARGFARLAIELESANVKVNIACPGFTATDLNDFRGTPTIQEAAREPVRLALLDANIPTGMFSNEDGPLPW